MSDEKPPAVLIKETLEAIDAKVTAHQAQLDTIGHVLDTCRVTIADVVVLVQGLEPLRHPAPLPVGVAGWAWLEMCGGVLLGGLLVGLVWTAWRGGLL